MENIAFYKVDQNEIFPFHICNDYYFINPVFVIKIIFYMLTDLPKVLYNE